MVSHTQNLTFCLRRLFARRYASRQGQAFSSTLSTVKLKPNQIKVVPDFSDEYGTYTFSDGIGLMSSEVAAKVTKKLNLHSKAGVPSAFQVRLGGAKGVLTVWDDAFPLDVDKEIHVILRDSMKKFDCIHKDIEVVGYSKRLALYLNRSLIGLLSAHGVPDHAFERLQRSVLRRLDRAMMPDGGPTAIKLLQSGVGGGIKELCGGTGTNVRAFFSAGLTCSNCEHLYNMMVAFRRQAMQQMLKKSRIPVDVDKGFAALGVLDELGILQEREIFCQYRDPYSGDLVVVEGDVTVGRNPALHPGDIQPMFAVNCNELRHLVDVIVFPRVGVRPITSMLGGGDLDGDLYFVVFDPSLALPRKPITPMNYTAPAPNTLSRPVKWRDVADFFVEFIANDRLGQIATAHAVHADKQPLGFFSGECLELATLHSIAVDFPKTGIRANLANRRLLPSQEPNSYPDFMNKSRKISYRSQRILGKLYRNCQAWDGDDKQIFNENWESKRITTIIEKFAKSDEMVEEGRKICQAYNAELYSLMTQFGVESEGEIISGYVSRFSGALQIKGKNDHFSLRSQLNKRVYQLRNQLRKYFLQGIEHSADSVRVIKAASWYKACRLEADLQRSMGKSLVLLSFPWVVSDILLGVIHHELTRRTD